MVSKQLKSSVWVNLFYLTIVASLCAAGFDLNEPPAENAMEETPRKVIKKVPASFYAKIERLFKVVSICDCEPADFNIKSIKIPDSFSNQNKAITALKAINNNNMFKPGDKPRYQRIIKNCAKINRAIQKASMAAQDKESQMSGVGYTAMMEKQIREMTISPMENIRARFASGMLALWDKAKSEVPPFLPKYRQPQQQQVEPKREEESLGIELDTPETPVRPTGKLITFF